VEVERDTFWQSPANTMLFSETDYERAAWSADEDFGRTATGPVRVTALSKGVPGFWISFVISGFAALLLNRTGLAHVARTLGSSFCIEALEGG